MTKTRKEHRRVKMATAHAEAHAAIQAIVTTGKCPDCGRPLRRNNSMTGWWQCSQLGAVGFRADPNQPSCNWQGFTE